MRHGTNELVCYCRNKQNCSNCSKTVRVSVLVFLALYMAFHQLDCHLKDSQSNISWSIFLPKERRQNFKENVYCVQNMGKEGNLFIGVVNVRQGCV
jgi:hypothetical protein